MNDSGESFPLLVETALGAALPPLALANHNAYDKPTLKGRLYVFGPPPYQGRTLDDWSSEMSDHSMTLTWNAEASENTKRVRNHRVACCSCGFEKSGPEVIVNRSAARHLEFASIRAGKI